MRASGRIGLGLGLLAMAAVSFGCAGMKHEAMGPRVLNNFVTEVLLVENLSENGTHLYPVDNPREGWLFFRSSAWADGSGKMNISIIPSRPRADKDRVIAYGPRDNRTVEAMRYLRKGSYMLRVDIKDAKLNSLTVRMIPAIIYDVVPSGPHLARFGRYDWAFLKRIGMLDSCNVIITGAEGFHFMKGWLAQGKQVLHQSGVPGLRGKEPVTVQSAYDYWINAPGMNNPGMSGVIADEFYPSLRDRFPVWVEAIKRVRKEKPDRVFYPYIAGSAKQLRSFVEPLLDSGCRFAYERYLKEMRTEEEARQFFEKALKNEMLDFQKYAPDFSARCIYVMGFLCGPNESLNKNPAVNYKVHTDIQFHLLATDALFKEGLYGVEEYRSSYCDEEYLRWCAKLFRHYCIEGSRERLTNDPYGLTHIQNPDFEKGVEGWAVTAASPDSVQVKEMKDYGWIQGRYPHDAQGDTFLWMKRSEEKPNLISQQIKNLTPGRYYSVKMYTGDYQDLTKWQQHEVLLRVEGAELVPEEAIQGVFHNCYSHLIPDKFGKTKTFFNFRRVVFKAVSKTARLVISDWQDLELASDSAIIGQETMFNFIEVEPYLMPE